jgi:long-chain acyl-CoA synthetase
MLTLNALLERQAAERPRAIALRLKDRALSYQQLQAQIERWATVLYSRGVRAGDTYGIVMRNSLEFVITFFALMRLGAMAVPVNFLLKSDEIAYIFDDAGVVGVITQKPFLGNILEAKARLARLREVVVAGVPASMTFLDPVVFAYEALLNGNAASLVPAAANTPETVAMIIYTSGTTGKPKGAMLTHGNFLANAEQCVAHVQSLSARDVFLCLLPMFHSFSWTVCVLLPMYLGCTAVILESIQPFSEVLKQIFKRRITIFVAVPPVFAALLRVPFWRPLRWINPVRLCVAGAAALPVAVHQKFEEKFGVPLVEGYGLTEASPVVSLNPIARRVPGSVGTPLPGVQIRITSEQGETLPQGEVGEICVKGANTMKGYFKQEQATREAFLDEQHVWLRTGDVGFVDTDGYIHISDRKKDLIIVKGLNVYPKEVEDILLTHPAVAEAAVVGIADETGDELIRAYVTLKKDQPVERQELLKLCRSKLAPYKCPKDLEIREELPKNTLGKILKRELRKS